MIGGHTAEMLQLVKSLDPTKYNPRSYIVADTDILSKEKATVYEQDLNQVKMQKSDAVLKLLSLIFNWDRELLIYTKYPEQEKWVNHG